ncbi:MAG TPA: decarboxylating 6-phosphogluconate dehydrogenase [Candidatus Competibacteraceae bacterium]|nr:decarboxylating 6-phosphogluconate dehydrogenase [Candidatus Competibacteraceae bacterium]
MKLGMIGVGRMGSNLVRRLLRQGHPCVVYDRDREALDPLIREGAIGAVSVEDAATQLTPPRLIWMMLPAGAVESTIASLLERLTANDILVDGGNSYYQEAIRRAHWLQSHGIYYVDVGTSGGIWGLEQGFCLMIGGADEAIQALTPVFTALAPTLDSAPRTPGRETLGGTAEQGYLHCGPSGAGHFVKMVHNGIEYGLMAAYAEGFNLLRHANLGKRESPVDAESTPLRTPEAYQYDFNLRDIAELWRRGSVIRSWLLDLTAHLLLEDPDLTAFHGLVADSGEGRWTVQTAIEEAVPVPVLSSALFARFSSRGQDDFAHRLLAALRREFGGHGAPHSDP